MAFEEMDMDMDDELEDDFSGPPPEESNNRTFLIVVGVLAAILVLALICTAAYAFLILPQSRNQKATQAAEINAQNTAVALGVTQTAEARRWTPTPRPSWTPTVTQLPTNTPVVAELATSTPTEDSVLATQNALYTLAAETTQTVIPTSTLLPSGGFADDVGVPGLVGIGVALVVVIFLVRRLRTAS
jgi:hypothetical protein